MTQKDEYEKSVAKLEGDRNKSSDEYFSARPHIDNHIMRKIFDAGFERGYKAALSEPEQVSLPDGWVAVEERLPNKPCFAYYENELGNSRIVKAKYVQQFSEEAYTDDDWIEYNEADDTYYYPAGWYEMIDNWDDYAFVTINHEVTHWMPLPAAPTCEKES